MSKLLQVYEHESLRVTFDAQRCIHAAECIRALPQVFDASARPWITPERAEPSEVIAAVQRCPTGALHVAINDEPVKLDANDVTVRAVRNGPLYVRGTARVVNAEGVEVLADERFALCRCGASNRKPFCDGSHRAIGFRDPL